MIEKKKYTILGPNGRFYIEKLDNCSININGQPNLFEIVDNAPEIKRVKFGSKFYNVLCEQIAEHIYDLWISHYVVRIEIEDSRSRLLSQFKLEPKAAIGKIIIRAPMPGLVSKIEIKKDEKVVVGQGLVILEAMKMENEIKSTIRGKVSSIEVTHGMTVEKEQPLLIIDSTD